MPYAGLRTSLSILRAAVNALVPLCVVSVVHYMLQMRSSDPVLCSFAALSCAQAGLVAGPPRSRPSSRRIATRRSACCPDNVNDRIRIANITELRPQIIHPSRTSDLGGIFAEDQNV